MRSVSPSAKLDKTVVIGVVWKRRGGRTALCTPPVDALRYTELHHVLLRHNSSTIKEKRLCSPGIETPAALERQYILFVVSLALKFVRCPTHS